MTKEDCFEIGSIIKPHGLHGELQAFLDADNLEFYLNIDSILLDQDGQLIPFFIEDLRLQAGQKVLMKLEGIDSQAEANELRKVKLYLPDEFVPELGEDEFFYHEIIGFLVIDTEKEELGKIETIYNLPQNDLLVVHYQKTEVLIPLKKELIIELDRENQKLLMQLPEGLLDVYLSSEEE